MKKYTVVMANLTEFENGGQKQQFTLSDLSDMAKTAQGRWVTWDFDPTARLGKILHAKVIDDELVATIEIDMPEVKHPVYCVPGILFTPLTLTEAAITYKPALKGLIPVVE